MWISSSWLVNSELSRLWISQFFRLLNVPHTGTEQVKGFVVMFTPLIQ